MAETFTPSPEQQEALDPREVLVTRQTEMLTNWGERGLALDNELWHGLVTEWRLDDLRASDVAQAYGLEQILALARSDGTIELDEAAFLALNPDQQQHLLAHETGHRIDAWQQLKELPAWQEIVELIDQLDANETSYYIGFLDQSVPDDEQKADKIRQEKVAEILGQFLTCNGSFRNMIEKKLLQFPGNTTEQFVWERYSEDMALMESLDTISELSAAEQEAFFAAQSDLLVHYQLFTKLQALFTDHEQFEQLIEGEFDYDWADEDIFVELPPLTENIPEQIPRPKPPAASLPKKPTGPKVTLNDFFSPLSIYKDATPAA